MARFIVTKQHIEVLKLIKSYGNATRADLEHIDQYMLQGLTRAGMIVSNDPDNYKNTTYFVSALGYAQITRSKPKTGELALPRTFVKRGDYAGLRFSHVREGSMDLYDAPSLHCGVRYYRDGRRESVES